MPTTVVNVRKDYFDIYIGRDTSYESARERQNKSALLAFGLVGSLGKQGYFGNPFPLKAKCDECGKVHYDTEQGRADLLKCYKAWFWRKVSFDRQFREAILQLKGHSLGCFCEPKACHGHVIRDFLAWTDTEAGKQWLDSLKPKTITIKDWLAMPEIERPNVTYKGDQVEKVYRDPTYRDVERFVIRLATIGYGSKKGDSELELV